MLVIEGAPGIGKTALIDSFLGRERPFAFRVVRIAGFSSEADMAYAGIDRLIMDMQVELVSLPEPLRRALAVATGRREGDPPDRFQVGLALLSLLGIFDGLTVWAIDDAHLLDEASLAVLAFVARRVKAESALIVFATRPHPGALETLAGFEIVRLSGLDTLSGVALLNLHRERDLDPHLAVKVVEQLEGHPLAIADLAKHTDAERLALRALSIEPLPPGLLLQGMYRQEIDDLPMESRDFALVAVSDTTGDIEVVRSAAAILGLPADASKALERTGLVELGERVRFRHQLVRAAVYNTASSVDRRHAHVALEAASEERGFHTAAAMHAAAFAVAPDVAVADRLEILADTAGARGALLSRAGFLSRARELTPDGPQRDERALTAAEAALAAGAALLTGELLASLDAGGLTSLSRGRYLSAQAFLPMFIGDPERIPRVAATFALAADAFHESSVELEQRALVNAFTSVLTTEESTDGITVPELAERILDGVETGSGLLDTVLRALHAHLVLPYSEASALIREALDVVQQGDGALLTEFGGCAMPLAMTVWEPNRALMFSQRMIERSTSRGALQALDTIHWTLSTVQVQLLDVAAAGRSLESVRELRRAIGYPAEHVVNAAHLALSGAPMESVDAAAASILATGFGGAHTFVQIGIGARLLGDGEYPAAYDRLARIVGSPFPHISRLALPDYVEAAARSGHFDDARSAVEALTALCAVTPTPWLAGLTKRSSALIATESTAEEQYLAAIRLLTDAGTPGDLARARLVYGEWLRRQRRRREAREQLAIAARGFDTLGAVPFAARARNEFATTGETVPPPASEAELTPQESLVADLAGAGRSNQEIAAALFISPNTVDYHLRKVFRKLGIASRKQLSDRRHA